MFMCAGLLANNADAQMKLIAKSVSNGPNDQLQDSVIYFHSGTKGTGQGEFKGKYNIPEFMLMEDSSYHYTNDNGTMKHDGRTVSTYQGTDVQEIITYELDNGAWENDERTEVNYGANNKPDTVFYQSWATFQGNPYWRDNARNIYTWSGNNYSSRIYQTRSFGGGGGWRNRYRYNVTYNGNGDQTSFVIAKWDNNGNVWEDSARIVTQYSGANITEINRSNWDGSNWVLNDRDFYTYDGQSRLEKIETEYDAGGSFNQDDQYLYYYTGSSTVPDSIVYKNNTFQTGFINQTKSTITANSNGDWVVERVESNDGNGGWTYVSTDSTTRWYYGWNLSVENIAAANNNIDIYPSPASNVITIKMDNITSDDITLAIVDIQGRTVKQWNESSTKVATVSVRDLAAGNYILKVMENGNVHTKQFVVSK